MRELVEKFKLEKGYYPTIVDFKSSNGLPTIRTVEKHGGIEKFYSEIGIEYRKGSRSFNAVLAKKRFGYFGFQGEIELYKELLPHYGEMRIHRHAPYGITTTHKSVFKIFLDTSTCFFVDVFFATNFHSFIDCVNQKLKKIRHLHITADIFFVSLNDECITEESIKKFYENRRAPFPDNVHLVTKKTALDVFKKLS